MNKKFTGHSSIKKRTATSFCIFLSDLPFTQFAARADRQRSRVSCWRTASQIEMLAVDKLNASGPERFGLP